MYKYLVWREKLKEWRSTNGRRFVKKKNAKQLLLSIFKARFKRAYILFEIAKRKKERTKMKIKIINRNYSIECNCDFDSLTIKEIDDLEKIIKELHTKFSEVKLQKEREIKNDL